MRLSVPALVAAAVALANPVISQQADIGFGGTRHDSSLPVEISADSLSVNQGAGTAVFQGGVRVGQGDLKFSADMIEVRYVAGNGQSGQVDQMRAVGNVLLTNGVEAAEAARATYSVVDGTVLMEGDVLLTQGANALSGQKLRINLDDGTAAMEGRVTTILQPPEN